MFERMTDRAWRVLDTAHKKARLLGHNFIGTEHLLLGLVAEGEGVAAKVLQSLDISLDHVRDTVEKIIGPSGSAASGAEPVTPRVKKVLELSLREALQLGHMRRCATVYGWSSPREKDCVSQNTLPRPSSISPEVSRVGRPFQLLIPAERGHQKDKPQVAS